MQTEKSTRVKNKLLEMGVQPPLTLAALPQDASNRSYYRMHDSHNHSWVIMDFEPGPHSLAEEKTPGDRGSFDELPFVNMQRWLKKHHVRVPEIYIIADDFLILEDLGDNTAHQWLSHQKATTAEMMTFYQHALDELVKIHASATSLSKACIGTTRQFDRETYNWEFDHFIDYGIEWLLGSRQDARHLRHYLFSITEKLCQFSICLNHRDYHSKNLIIDPQGAVRVIDFQDAIMAPCHYDLASLFFDSYFDLSDSMIGDLLHYYLENVNADFVHDDFELFNVELRMMALQRNLKAAGRFVYLFAKKGRATYLPYVIPTMKKVKQHLKHLGANTEFTASIPFAKIEQKINTLMEQGA